MAADLFVYGTLRDPKTCGGLLGRMPQQSTARLHGFMRLAVRGEAYPAIVPCPQKSVDGLILRGLSAHELEVLDAYEGAEYRRVEVEAELETGATPAWVYVWVDEADRLGPEA